MKSCIYIISHELDTEMTRKVLCNSNGIHAFSNGGWRKERDDIVHWGDSSECVEIIMRVPFSYAILGEISEMEVVSYLNQNIECDPSLAVPFSSVL